MKDARILKLHIILKNGFIRGDELFIKGSSTTNPEEFSRTLEELSDNNVIQLRTMEGNLTNKVSKLERIVVSDAA